MKKQNKKLKRKPVNKPSQMPSKKNKVKAKYGRTKKQEQLRLQRNKNTFRQCLEDLQTAQMVRFGTTVYAPFNNFNPVGKYSDLGVHSFAQLPHWDADELSSAWETMKDLVPPNTFIVGLMGGDYETLYQASASTTRISLIIYTLNDGENLNGEQHTLFIKNLCEQMFPDKEIRLGSDTQSIQDNGFIEAYSNAAIFVNEPIETYCNQAINTAIQKQIQSQIGGGNNG